MKMRTDTANCLIKFISSKEEKSLLFGLREIVKRVFQSPDNSQVFRSLGLVPLLFNLLPTSNEEVLIYICKILCGLIHNNSAIEITKSGKLPILLNYLFKDGFSKKILCETCTLIEYLLENDVESRRQIYSCDIIDKINILLKKYKDDNEILEILIKLIRNLISNRSDCILLERKKCLLAICQYGIKADVSNELIDISLNTLFKFLCKNRTEAVIKQITDGTNSFKSLYEILWKLDNINELIISIVLQIADRYTEPNHIECNNSKNMTIINIILAKFPAACMIFLSHHNKLIQVNSFNLLLRLCEINFLAKMSTNDVACTAAFQLWYQICLNESVLVKLIFYPDVDNGLHIQENRKLILRCFLSAYNCCTGEMVASTLVRGNFFTVFNSIFNEYLKFSLDENNIAQDSTVQNVEGECLHKSCHLVNKSAKRKRSCESEHLNFYSCMELMELLLNVLEMILLYHKQLGVVELMLVCEVLLKYITNGKLIVKKALTSLFKCIKRLLQCEYGVVRRNFILSRLLSVSSNNTKQCKSCAVLKDGTDEIVCYMASHLRSNRILSIQDDKTKFFYLVEYALVTSSLKDLHETNRKLGLIPDLLRYLITSADDLNQKYSFQSILAVAESLKNYEKESTKRNEILEKTFIYFECGMQCDRYGYFSEITETSNMHHNARIARQMICHNNAVSPCKLEEITSDMEFLVEGQSLKVNRSFLSEVNHVFEVMLQGQFKEGKENTVPINQYSLNVFRFFIHSIYGCNCSITAAPIFNIYDNVELFHLAEMYNHPPLRFYAIKSISCYLNLELDDNLQILVDLRQILNERCYGILLAMTLIQSRQENRNKWIDYLRMNENNPKLLSIEFGAILQIYYKMDG